MIQFFNHIQYLSLVPCNYVISDEVDMDREISPQNLMECLHGNHSEIVVIKIRMLWSSGYEDYDVHELDFFINRATANDEKAKKAVKGLSDKLYHNYENHLDFELSVQNFLNMLHICEFITRELNPIQTDDKAKSNSEHLQKENA